MGGVNFDTSVLVDYLLIELDDQLEVERLSTGVSDPAATTALLEDEERERVIGGKVDGEFGALTERHHDIYEDLVKWAGRRPETPLVDYDPIERDVHTTENDRDFLRFEILFRWSGDDREKQLSGFRRLKQNVSQIERGVRGLLDETYPRYDDEESLQRELTGLGLDHDEEVVVDAVVIAEQDGINQLVSTDDGLTDQQSAINDRVSAAGRDVSLRIDEPDGV